MRKFLCATVCAFLVLSLLACNKAGNDPVLSTGSDATIPSESLLPVSSDTSSEAPSSSQPTESIVSSSEPQVSSEMPVSSEPTSSAPPAPIPTPQPAPLPEITPLEPFTYTVEDPDNLRGLATERRGFSFGVAKDGQPHSQSILNQSTFDGFANVSALALDRRTTEKVMYLTFDNGYEYENLTASILDTLKAKGVKAAFFVTLSYAKQNPQLVMRMINEGHIVGNHSTTHPSFPGLSRTRMAEEIATLDNYLRGTFGYSSPFFRFPEGAHSESSLELVTSIGFNSVFWSVAYSDWSTADQKGADYAFSTVTSRFHPGAVILLHAVSRDNADALGRIIDQATAEGYTFKTLWDYFG